MPTKTEVTNWRGLDMVDSYGDRIGKVDDVYLDVETDEPEWALVHTGMFGTKSTFVPIANARADADALTVPFSKDQVKDAPKADPGVELGQDEEAALYRHYGMDYSESRSDSGLPEGGAPPADKTSGDSVTRSEEELRIGESRRTAGTARLRKFVETEQVETTVPVEHERARVTREQLAPDAPVDGDTIGEREITVELTDEVVDVEKATVAKERISLGKETVTEQQRVQDEIRKERVEVEGDVSDDRR